MAEDDRRQSAGREHERGGSRAAQQDAVVLPEHASAYFSPRPPPISTEHPTLETRPVRLDPAIDPDRAPTQRISVDGLQPPPWLGEPLRSDAPTVLVPIVRARKRRQRLLAGIAAAAVGAAAGIFYGLRVPRHDGETSLPRQDRGGLVARRPTASSGPKEMASAAV